jgi:hypothetical protein
MISAPPIDSVCLKQVAAIRREQNNAPAGLEDADHFANRGPIILDVLDYLVAEDQVKGRGRQWEKFPGCIENMWIV